MDVKLTKAQTRVLRALQNLKKVNPRPSLAEWAEVAGKEGKPLTLPCLMHHRAILVACDMIANEPGKTRSTHLTERGINYLRRTT